MHWGEYTDHRDRDLPSGTAHANCSDTGLTGHAVRDPVSEMQGEEACRGRAI